MKIPRPLLASLATLFAACLAPAVGSEPVNHVLAVLHVDTDDPAGYATWLKDYNATAKARVEVDDYLRVFETIFDGRRSGRVVVAVAASNAVELTQRTAALETDPAIMRNREHLRAIRKTGARVLYQSVYFESAPPKGAQTYTTIAMISDETSYVNAIRQLRGVFDAIGLKDIQVAVYRTLAGRTDHTHAVVMSAPSAERLAAFLDATATNPQLIAWIASSNKFRTVVANSTAREITQ